jgi:ribokinase
VNAAPLAVIGAINVDLVVTGAPLPGPGETVVGGSFGQHHGGKGGNQAVAAARAGTGRVAMIGAVGDDPFGAGSLAALSQDGVDITHVPRVASSATGVALIAVDANGENQISVAPGANGSLTPARVTAALYDVAPSVVLASLEVPLDAVRAAADWARDRGALFVLNPAPVGPGAATLLPFASVVTPNEGEATALGPVPAGVAVVQTRGAAGATIISGRGRTDVPAPAVQAVDTTGAGDCFNGVLAAALREGLDLGDAVARAVAGAALAVTEAGARAGMPTREAVDRMLEAG